MGWRHKEALLLMVTEMTGDRKTHPAVRRGGTANLVIPLEFMHGGNLLIWMDLFFSISWHMWTKKSQWPFSKWNVLKWHNETFSNKITIKKKIKISWNTPPIGNHYWHSSSGLFRTLSKCVLHMSVYCFMIQSFPAHSTPASQNLGGTSPSWVGPRDLPFGALALGKAIAGPSPNFGPPPGQHKRGIFLSLVYRVCSRLKAFLGYEIQLN